MKHFVIILFVLVLSSCYVQSEYPYRDEPPAKPRPEFRIYWYPCPPPYGYYYYRSYPYNPYYWAPPKPKPNPPRYNGPRRR